VPTLTHGIALPADVASRIKLVTPNSFVVRVHPSLARPPEAKPRHRRPVTLSAIPCPHHFFPVLACSACYLPLTALLSARSDSFASTFRRRTACVRVCAPIPRTSPDALSEAPPPAPCCQRVLPGCCQLLACAFPHHFFPVLACVGCQLALCACL
jgi:hypothetical protein